MLLAVDEETDEAVGVFFEDFFPASREAAIADGVVIELNDLGLLFPEGEEAEASGLIGVLELENLEDRLGVVVNVPCVAVVVPHQGFNPAEDGGFRVAEFISEDALETEGEDVISLIVIVEGIPHAVHEVERVFELATGEAGEDFFLHQLGHGAGASF